MAANGPTLTTTHSLAHSSAFVSTKLAAHTTAVLTAKLPSFRLSSFGAVCWSDISTLLSTCIETLHRTDQTANRPTVHCPYGFPFDGSVVSTDGAAHRAADGCPIDRSVSVPLRAAISAAL